MQERFVGIGRFAAGLVDHGRRGPPPHRWVAKVVGYGGLYASFPYQKPVCVGDLLKEGSMRLSLSGDVIIGGSTYLEETARR